jgi:alkaline phosphatase
MKTNLLLLLVMGLLFSFGAEAQKRPKNIILLIGDGMGVAQVHAGMVANGGHSHFTRFPAIGFSKTQSANAFVTDSGAGGTAIAIGHKTNNGMVGVDAAGVPQTSILEIAEQNGLSTGVIVTCSITHATPADFYAHQASRSQNEDIADDLLKSGIDVFVGGGRQYFAKRKDGRDLLAELKAQGYAVADSTEDLAKFTSGKLAYFTAAGEPASVLKGRPDFLHRGTKTALGLVGQNPKGFFVMVEGSQIDWEGHANNIEGIVKEVQDFEKAVGVALDFAEKDGQTLVIVTADHETGGLALNGGDPKANKVMAGFTSLNHTGIMVPVFAYGPGAEKFIGIYENTSLFDKMKTLWGYKNATEELVFHAKRQVQLQGTSNFRDLGGYPAQGGKAVKWGQLYRSADVSKLTDADLATLQGLNLAVNCDLRGPQEVQTAPDRMPAGVKYLNLPAGSENVGNASSYLAQVKTAAQADSLIRAGYTNTTHFKAKYRPMFDQLLALPSGKSLLFHCTAGKDRTGIGAALILSALGVDKNYILADYAATNVFWQAEAERRVAQMTQAGTKAELMRPMMAANPGYLEQTFASIDRQYGSLANFLKKEMGLTDDKLAKLRAKYLE